MKADDGLKGWSEFAAARLPPRNEADRRFVLFQARWRLAQCFQGLDAPDFSEPIRDTYGAAFKVFLAYAAHEQLARALNRDHYDFTLDSDELLAGLVREALQPLRPLLEGDAKPQQLKGIQAFWAVEHHDVRFVAYGIRNLVAHGPFTATRWRTKRVQGVLGALADSVLDADEKWFQELVVSPEAG